MAQISTCQENEKTVLLVKYVVFMGPVISHSLLTDDGERLALAVQLTPGARKSKPKYIGSASATGLREDEYEHYECMLEPTVANVTALRAAAFDWDEKALLLVESQEVQPEVIAKIRDDIETAIKNKRQQIQDLLNQATRVGTKNPRRWWQFGKRW
jgi:hypothetical protein